MLLDCNGDDDGGDGVDAAAAAVGSASHAC